MIRNIYESKNYKMLALVPIALLLISLFFIPRIPLDSTLKGGIAVQLQISNTSYSLQGLTSQIDSKIPGAQASLSSAPGGISVTMATNTSLANAQQQLLDIYGTEANYSAASVSIAAVQNQMRNQTNATLQSELATAQGNQTKALSQLNAQTGALLAGLKPLLNGQTFQYNATDAQQMVSVSQSAYTGATKNYEIHIIGILQSIIPFTSYSYQEVTPTLGAYFLGEIQGILIASFIIVAIAVFIIFKTPIPSLSVVFGAGNDILIALGAMGLFGIPLGVAAIGGLLMLVGYSIDTDMLAAIRIIKRGEGTPSERAFNSMKTGMTMTFAAIISFAILLVVSYITFIPTYFEISSVVLFGLIADLATTWLGNTTMVLWWKQRKELRR